MQQDQFLAWSNALADDADILIYGCNLAASESGEMLVESLASLTGADVAASDDLTGHESLGGDWELEYRAGEIDAEVVVNETIMRDWSGVLDAAQVYANYTETPLAFEQNTGQFDTAVDYLARGSGYAAYLTDGDAVITLDRADGSSHAVRLDVVEANANPAATGENLLASRSNYLIGTPDRWRTDIANYGAVRFEGVYDGIDLIYYGSQRQLQYDFIVDPGVDSNQIRLDFSGADTVALADNGDLVLTLTEAGDTAISSMRPGTANLSPANIGSTRTVRSGSP